MAHADAYEPAGLEPLSHTDCVALLAANEVGRLAMIWEDAPLILPVNYRWDGSAVLFRTDPGTKLGASRDRPVAFEIDGYDREECLGWSVVVKGHGRVVGPHQLPSGQVGLWSWAVSPKHYWVRIEPTEITGRRITRTPPKRS